MAKRPWHKEVFDVIWKEGLKYLLAPLFALISTLLVRWLRHMSDALTINNLLIAGSIFCVSLAGILSIAKLAVWGIKLLIRWLHPPTLRITAHGGRCAALEIQHSGIVTTWEARMRILPNSLSRRCLFEKDGRPQQSLPFTDGDIATIILAEIKRDHYTNPRREIWTSIPNPDEEFDTRVDSGARVEVNLYTKPRQKRFAITKCFEITNRSDILSCTEVACN